MHLLFSNKADSSRSPAPVDEIAVEKAVAFFAVHCERTETLKRLRCIPAENAATLLWTLNSFNAFTFIPFAINTFGLIDCLTVSTYSINRRIVDALMRETDRGRIRRILFLVSDSLRVRMPKVTEYLESLALARVDTITVRYGWNHSKVTCIQCGNTYLTVEGSGNWSENAQYEQYVIFNSREIYEFRKKNIEDVA
jgi:hypothetical protein